MKKKLLISFSGGRTSAFMTHWLLQNKSDEYEMMIVFSNTGRERRETLDFVDMCNKRLFNNQLHIVEPVINPQLGIGPSAKKLDILTLSTNGEPFKAGIAKYGIPNMANPWCSKVLKKQTIRAYAKYLGWKKYETAIGIRIDEMDRQSENKDAERLIYPLISMAPSKKTDINEFWSKQDFDLQLKSYEGNCDFCWKKSLNKLCTIAKENPKKLEWWKDMEDMYENFIPESRLHNLKITKPIRFFRDKKSTSDIVELSNQPFRPARDESKDVERYKQTCLFTEFESPYGCEESCEAF